MEKVYLKRKGFELVGILPVHYPNKTRSKAVFIPSTPEEKEQRRQKYLRERPHLQDKNKTWDTIHTKILDANFAGPLLWLSL